MADHLVNINDTGTGSETIRLSLASSTVPTVGTTAVPSFSLEANIIPMMTNVRQLNAKFLREFVFNNKVPVVTEFTRESIKPPLMVIVSNPNDGLKPAGIGYDIGDYSGGFDNIGVVPDPWIAWGVYATGTVQITVAADDPKERDRKFVQVMAAYFSLEGRCWLVSQPEIRVHGYNPTGKSEVNLELPFGSSVIPWYTATLTFRFDYDIVVAKMLKFITAIGAYPIVVMSQEDLDEPVVH